MHLQYIIGTHNTHTQNHKKEKEAQEVIVLVGELLQNALNGVANSDVSHGVLYTQEEKGHHRDHRKSF